MNRKQLEEQFTQVNKYFNDFVFGKIDLGINLGIIDQSKLNPAFPFPQKFCVTLLKSHMVFEMVGPSIDKDDTYDFVGSVYRDMSFNEHIGIPTDNILMEFPGEQQILNGMSYFSHEAFGELITKGLDVSQMPSNMTAIGMLPKFIEEKRCLMNNVDLFWKEGDSIVHKRIDYLDAIPLQSLDVENGEELEFEGFEFDKTNSTDIIRQIVQFVFNKRNDLHKMIREFVLFLRTKDPSEPEITKYLENVPELLQYPFGFSRLHPQTVLVSQVQPTQPNLIPDFLPEQADGYSCILEFKLMDNAQNPLVGKVNRQRPNAELASYISQVHTYKEWTDQIPNRDWLEQKYGIKLINPNVIIIWGHSNDFDAKERRLLSSRMNVQIFTYDEFIERAQFFAYKMQ